MLLTLAFQINQEVLCCSESIDDTEEEPSTQHENVIAEIALGHDHLLQYLNLEKNSVRSSYLIL